MKTPYKFIDSDGAIYTLTQITELNKSDELFTPEELNELSKINIGHKLCVDMGEWIKRIY